MARTITRQTLALFGSTGASTNFAEFGSQAASAPVKTKTIATIQALAAYADGWQSAVALGNAPYLEDMNALFYLKSYQLCYLMQEGVPEWDSGTTYFTGSLVKSIANAGYTEFYVSLTDANLNNALPTRINNTNWQFLYARSASGLIIPGLVGDVSGGNAAAGIVGEVLRAIAGATNFPASSTWGDLTSLSLTAGDWDMSAIGTFLGSGGAGSEWRIGISTTAGNSTTGLTFGDNHIGRNAAFPTSGAALDGLVIPAYRVSLSSTTTVYFKYYAVYSGGVSQLAGRLVARRLR